MKTNIDFSDNIGGNVLLGCPGFVEQAYFFDLAGKADTNETLAMLKK